MLTSQQLKAARVTLGWDRANLAKMSGVSAETIKRLEGMDGPLAATKVGTLEAIKRALEAGGVAFSDNGHGPGVHFPSRKLPAVD